MPTSSILNNVVIKDSQAAEIIVSILEHGEVQHRKTNVLYIPHRNTATPDGIKEFLHLLFP